MSNIDNLLKVHIQRLALEQESLIAKFIAEKKCLASEVCLVQARTPSGLVFFVDFKANYGPEELIEKDLG